MSRKFNHPYCSILAITGNPQRVAAELVSERFVQTVIAREDFRCLGLAIDPMRLTAGNDLYVSGLPDKRAGESTD